MKLKQIFDKEAFTVRYWLHIALDAFIILAILQYFTGGEMLTVKNFLWSIPLIGVADVFTHATFKFFGHKI